MNILVIGPGAIGCLFSGSLAAAGTLTQLFDKDESRAKLLNENGITIKKDSSQTVSVDVITKVSDAEKPDYICICVKSYDTAAAAKTALAAAVPETYIVSIQNGIGNAEIISDVCQTDRVLCLATTQGASTIQPGVVKHAGFGPTTVAAVGAKHHPGAMHFADILSSAGIPASTRKDPCSMLWSKLIINTAINPLTALHNIPNGKLLEDDNLKHIMISAAYEAEEVAHKIGIKTDFDDAAEAVEKVCRQTENNISSMLQDIRAGKRTEIDAITGAVIRAAETAGAEVPINRDLWERVNKLSEQGQ